MLGCSSVPLTGRRQLNLVSDQEVLALSNQSFSDYMKTAKVSTDYMKTLQVARVGQRIANAVMSFLRNNGMTADAASYNWQFVLVNDNTPNAFCMPGGKVVVNTGYFRTLSMMTDWLSFSDMRSLMPSPNTAANESASKCSFNMAE